MDTNCFSDRLLWRGKEGEREGGREDWREREGEREGGRREGEGERGRERGREGVSKYMYMYVCKSSPEDHTHSDLPTVEWVGSHFIRQLQILILCQLLVL